MEKRGRKSGRELKFTQKNLKHKLSASEGFTDSLNNVACHLCRHYSTSKWIRFHYCATWWHEECIQYSAFGEFTIFVENTCVLLWPRSLNLESARVRMCVFFKRSCIFLRSQERWVMFVFDAQ
nr:unnamed protein product [Callosobruchus chinensis]